MSVMLLRRTNEVIASLDSIGKACPNVERMTCIPESIPPSGSRVWFETPKPKLVKLSVIASYATTLVVDNMFEVLAEKVSTLQHFHYKGPSPSDGCWRSLVPANQSMKAVTLELSYESGRSCPCSPSQGEEESRKRVLNTVLNAFLLNKGLLCLNVSCDGIYFTWGCKHSDFADMSEPARFGGKSVTIFGITYV